MKAYKKIISFILTLVMMLSLSVNVFAAEPLTDDPNMIEWKYTVFADESLQKVVEEGVIPNAYARYTWRGITLKNGEVAILTPSNNSMGLYCNSGRYITINYTLSRSAFHRSRVRAYVAGPSSEFVREITASGLRSGFTTQATDYYYGIVDTRCVYLVYCIIHKNLIGYVYCDDRVAFVLNIFLERFVNDTVDYHIHYVGVDSLDEECIECRKYSDYCEHILPAFWIDDDFCE